MTRQRSTSLVLAVVAALTAACSDAPGSRLSPNVPPLSASKSAKKSVTVERSTPLTSDLTQSLTVDRRGGTIEIKDAGLKLTVPSNALPDGTESLTITVTALAGQQFAYEFEPSGTQFTRPLKFEQDLGNAQGSKKSLDVPVVSYFKSRGDIDANALGAVTFEDLLSNVDIKGHRVVADVWHFSGYIVCWGRSQGNQDEQ